MATSASFTMDLRSQWSRRQSNSDTSVSITDVGGFRANKTASYGVRTQNIDAIYHIDNITLPSGQSHDYDLFALPQSLFGIDTTYSFSGGIIKGIVLQNLEESNGADISICGSGAEGYTAPWGGSTGCNIVGAMCQLPLINILDGFRDLDDTHHIISVNDDSGSGCSYQLLIVGVTGSGPYN